MWIFKCLYFYIFLHQFILFPKHRPINRPKLNALMIVKLITYCLTIVVLCIYVCKSMLHVYMHVYYVYIYIFFYHIMVNKDSHKFCFVKKFVLHCF